MRPSFVSVLAGSMLVVAAACREATVLGPTPTGSLTRAPTADKKAPTAPANLRATGTTAYSVSLVWDASTDNSGILSYRVVSSSGSSITVPGTATSVTFASWLQPRGTYSFWVYAVDEAGNASRNSNAVSATLPADTDAPAAPTFSVTSSGPTHLSLAWSAEDDDPSLVYVVSLNGSPVVSGSTTSQTFTPLQPGTTYTFAARARDDGGNWSPSSAPFSVTTPQADPNDATPPSAPTNVGADLLGDGSRELLVTWTASTDNLSAQSRIQYQVLLNGELADVTVGTTHSTVYGVAGENVISVIAIDEASNKSSAGTVRIVLP